MTDKPLEYNIDGIRTAARKRMRRNTVLLLLSSAFLGIAIVLFLIFNSNIIIFTGSLIAGSCALFVFLSTVKTLSSVCRREMCGEILYVTKKITVDRIGLIGMRIMRRKYSSYQNDVLNLVLYIKDGENVKSHSLSHINEAHAEYYDMRGAVICISGTRFPIRTIPSDRRLCPVCGGFAPACEKYCSECKTKVLN